MKKQIALIQLLSTRFMKDSLLVLTLFFYSFYCAAQVQQGKEDMPYSGEIGDFLPCVLTFRTGQSDINQTHMKPLADVSAFLKNHPDVSIVIVGSAQGVGGSGQKIAEARAVKVKQALINQYKISPSRLIANMHRFSGSINDLGLIKHFTGTSDAVVFYEQGFTVLDECMAVYEGEMNRKLQPIAGFMIGALLGYDCPVCGGTGYVNGHKCDRCTVDGNPTGVDAKRSLSDGMKIAEGMVAQGRGNNNIYKKAGNSGWERKQYDEGIYEGHMVNGKRNGWGMIIYRSGQCYTGLWKDDKIAVRGMLRKTPYRMSSQGRKMLCDREVGSIDNNGRMANNRAVLRWNGTTYVGNFKNGRFNGYGEITDEYGKTLKTNFVDGKPGKGTCNVGLMGVIEGDFSNCDLNAETVSLTHQIKGKAKFIYPDGGYYIGGLKGGFPNGKGVLTMTNGDELEAWFKGDFGRLDASKPSVAKFKNGDIYVGYGGIRPEGQGTMLYAATHEYVKGKWSGGKILEKQEIGKYTDNELLQGKRTKRYDNGDSYTGGMLYVLPNGTGTYTYANGDKLFGKFEYGEPYGTIELTFSNGEQYIGELKNGKMHGKGIYTYQNGDKFNGIFENGKRHGEGVMKYKNNKYVYGYWFEDKLSVKYDEGKWKKKGDDIEYKSNSKK